MLGSAPWRPHERLEQADAVFRTLRQHVEHTEQHAYGTRWGYAECRGHQQESRIVWGVETEMDSKATEAMALLRCACLAMATRAQEAHA